MFLRSDQVFRTCTWAVAALGLALSACGLLQPTAVSADHVVLPVSRSRSESASAPAPVVMSASAPLLQPTLQLEPADTAARRFLAYHDQLRSLSAAELGLEITRVNGLISANPSSAAPALMLELALALAQARGPGDLARALAVLDPLVRSGAPELQPWQALARLLVARLADQRRLEDQLERQAAQLRDTQRTLAQTHEKLEALKAIERSLNVKPAVSTVPKTP